MFYSVINTPVSETRDLFIGPAVGLGRVFRTVGWAYVVNRVHALYSPSIYTSSVSITSAPLQNFMGMKCFKTFTT